MDISLENKEKDRKIPFQIPAYLQSFSSYATGGMKFQFITQENVKADDLTRLISYKDKLGYLTFNAEVIEAADLTPLLNIKIDRTKYDNAKTPSQRLHSVLWLIHEKKGGKPETFQRYYDEIMEFYIELYKKKLNEL